MLQQRLLAGSIMIAALVAVLCLDFYVLHDSILFHALFLCGVWLSLLEFWKLCRATGHQTFSIWGTFCGCALVAVHYYCMRLDAEIGNTAAQQLSANVFMGALAVAVLGTFLLAAKRQFEASLGAVAVTCLGLLYVFFLPSFVLTLRHLSPTGLLGGPGWKVFGHKMVIATIVLAKGCDVWAFLFGKMLGKHKAFPRLSPGKTIEGLAAGLVGSILTALFLHWAPVGVLSRFSIANTCVLGFCIGFAGIMGDLSESLLKRSAGAKDAGMVVPGFGGAMDVVDSLMVAGPVAYFLIQAML